MTSLGLGTVVGEVAVSSTGETKKSNGGSLVSEVRSGGKVEDILARLANESGKLATKQYLEEQIGHEISDEEFYRAVRILLGRGIIEFTWEREAAVTPEVRAISSR